MSKLVLRSLSLTAGQRLPVHEVASFFMLISNTGSLRIKIAIDNDPLSEFPIGYEYREKEGEYYQKVTFQNPNAGTVVVEYIMSTGLVRGTPTITALDNILDELRGKTSPGASGVEKTVGLVAEFLLGENTDRKACCFMAKSTNTGIIYIAFTGSVSPTNWLAELLPSQSIMMDDYRGQFFGIADVADQKLGWGEW